MSITDFSVKETVKRIKEDLQKDSTISPVMRSSVELLLLMVQLMANKLGLNSDNSSCPPSQDKNKNINKAEKKKSDKKTGGQVGHPGTTLELVNNPDEIKIVIGTASLLIGTVL